MCCETPADLEFWQKKFQVVRIPILISIGKNEVKGSLEFRRQFVSIAETCIHKLAQSGLFEIFQGCFMSSFIYLDGNKLDLEKECNRYGRLLDRYPPDIVCLGIGENGHIAFNDPGVADFDDPQVVKVVELDERSRWQQVHDGCFPDIELVPNQALTMTIPSLVSGARLYCVVPGVTKAEAVHKTLRGPVTENCPASILRCHDSAKLYLDRESARLI